jgi:hypothetical protein
MITVRARSVKAVAASLVGIRHWHVERAPLGFPGHRPLRERHHSWTSCASRSTRWRASHQVSPELGMNARGQVGPAGPLVDRPDLRQELAVGLGSGREGPRLPRVVPAGGDAQHPARVTMRCVPWRALTNSNPWTGASWSPGRIRPRLFGGCPALRGGPSLPDAGGALPPAPGWSGRPRGGRHRDRPA